MKYGEVKIDTTGIRDIDRDGGFTSEDFSKMVSQEYVLNQCGEVKENKEN